MATLTKVVDCSSQQEDNHFRFELLNRVDEVIFFNPALQNQRYIARLPMTDEQNKGLTITDFFHLFQTSHDPVSFHFISFSTKMISF